METLLYYIFWVFINLDLLALGALALGLFFIFRHRQKAARVFLMMGSMILLIVNLSPLGPMIIMHLENRIPCPTELPRDIEGLILLGGSFALAETKERGEPVYNMAGTRIHQFMELARKYPQAKLILTGNKVEGEYSQKLLLNNGFPPERILLEDDSRATQDHPVKLKDLVDISKKYLLVTSAFHMSRSFGLFKKQGFDVVPYPVDYHTPGKMSLLFWMSSVLQRITPMAFKQACLEWAGLISNYAKGLSHHVFPKVSP